MRSRATQTARGQARQTAVNGLEALDYPGTSGRVVLPPDPSLTGALAACLSGWSPRVTKLQRKPDSILVAIAPARGGLYHLQSRYIDGISTDLPLASTVCALIADLSQDWSETARGTIGLHGGAVQIGGQLLLLTGKARAGKSTLITRLATAPGVTFFCDDVLPVNTRSEGISLGIAPRLRLPVPQGAAALQRLVRQDLILADDRYGYVRVPDQAPHGTTAPLGAILLLDRREGEAARLHRLDPAEALSTILHQSITSFASAEAAFARTRALVNTRPCIRLVYSDLEEAHALILRSFGPGGVMPDLLPPLLAIASDPDAPPPSVPKAVPETAIYRRAARPRLRRLGQVAFLWQPGEPVLWEMNPVAHAVWQMLELPGSASDLSSALEELFPDIAPARLMADVAQHMAALEEAGLILADDRDCPC